VYGKGSSAKGDALLCDQVLGMPLMCVLVHRGLAELDMAQVRKHLEVSPRLVPHSSSRQQPTGQQQQQLPPHHVGKGKPCLDLDGAI
jgi:hypothetical protein